MHHWLLWATGCSCVCVCEFLAEVGVGLGGCYVLSLHNWWKSRARKSLESVENLRMELCWINCQIQISCRGGGFYVKNVSLLSFNRWGWWHCIYIRSLRHFGSGSIITLVASDRSKVWSGRIMPPCQKYSFILVPIHTVIVISWHFEDSSCKCPPLQQWWGKSVQVAETSERTLTLGGWPTAGKET